MGCVSGGVCPPRGARAQGCTRGGALGALASQQEKDTNFDAPAARRGGTQGRNQGLRGRSDCASAGAWPPAWGPRPRAEPEGRRCSDPVGPRAIKRTQTLITPSVVSVCCFDARGCFSRTFPVFSPQNLVDSSARNVLEFSRVFQTRPRAARAGASGKNPGIERTEGHKPVRQMPAWPNGHGAPLLRVRLWVRVPSWVLTVARS